MENEVILNDENSTQTINSKKKTSFFEFLSIPLVIFGICFVIFTYLFQILFIAVDVEGRSMQPTINASLTSPTAPGTDYVYIMKSNIIKNGDIVVINEGKIPNEDYKIIKRVIATPGQTITFKKTSEKPSAQKILYSVYLDNKKLNEEYILEKENYFSTVNDTNYPFYNSIVADLQSSQTGHSWSLTLGKDEYFVMGDNRNNSTDSRKFGVVKKDEIFGKVVLIVRENQNLLQAIWSNIFGSKLLYC